MTDLEAAIAEIAERVVRRLLEERQQPQADQYLSTVAAARLADVGAATIRRWIKLGKLTRHQAGREIRVSRVELELLLKRGIANDGETPEQMAERMFG